MSAKLVVAPEAELDIAEAYIWYERRRIGLGEEYLSSVDACMESIRRHFVITAYELTGKPLAAFRRRRRKKQQ